MSSEQTRVPGGAGQDPHGSGTVDPAGHAPELSPAEARVDGGVGLRLAYPEPRVRLAIRVPDFLGDFLTCLPGIDLLRASGAGCEVIGSPRLAPFCEAIGVRLHRVRDRKDVAEIYGRLDVDFGLSFRTSSIRNVLEMRRAGLRPLSASQQILLVLVRNSPLRYLHGSKVGWMYGIARRAARKLDLGGPLPPASAPFIDLPVPEAWDVAIGERLRDEGIEGPFVLCNPIADQKGRKPGWREWPGFGDLIEHLVAEHGLTVLACPGPGEAERVQAAASAVRILEGVDIAGLAAISRRADLVLSNDTGPMHIAAAVGAPTVGIFGETSPREWGPHGARSVVVGKMGRWPSTEEVLATARRLNPGLFGR